MPPGSVRVMDDQHRDEQTTAGSLDGTGATSEVDAVLASLDTLQERPVAEHVAVFEQAHERLRRALDAPSG